MTKKTPSGPEFLENPVIETETYEGETLSVYIHLQDRKAVRDTQPQPDVPVFISVDASGFPTGIRLYAPIPGRLVLKVIDEMVLGADGRPHGMNRRVHCDYVVAPAWRDLVARLMKHASRVLEMR